MKGSDEAGSLTWHMEADGNHTQENVEQGETHANDLCLLINRGVYGVPDSQEGVSPVIFGVVQSCRVNVVKCGMNPVNPM